MKKRGTLTVKNEGFGNRCTECGHFFEDGVCPNGHIQGELHIVKIKTSKKKDKK